MQNSGDREYWFVLRRSSNDGTDLGDHKSLDFASMWDMGTNTKIDHGATSVYCRRCAVWNFAFYEILLVFVVLQSSFCELQMKYSVESLRNTPNISKSVSFDTTKRSNF